MTRTKLIAMLMISALFAAMVPGEDSEALDGRMPAPRESTRDAERAAPFTWLAQAQPAAARRTPR